MTIRYGLIGSGMMGREHIRNLDLLDGCEVTALFDPDPAMRDLSVQTTRGRARAFCDYREMLSSGLVDALVIASSNDTHHAIMMDVLDTGLPILCEKPLCTNVEHCREVVAKAEGRAAPVWVAMEYRFMPPFQRLLSEVRGGTIGTPRMMTVREHRFPFLEKVGHWNRFSARTGGTLVEKCCHFWDLMRFTLESDPVRVYASGAMDVNHKDEAYDGRTPDILDNAFVIVDFANGTRGMLDLCMFAEGSRWQEMISVTGEKARIDARVPGPARFSLDGRERAAEIEISHRATKEVTVEEVAVDETILAAGDHHGSTFYQHRKFRDLILAGHGTPDVTLMDGLWSVAVGQAAEESVRSGQAIDLRGVV